MTSSWKTVSISLHLLSSDNSDPLLCDWLSTFMNDRLIFCCILFCVLWAVAADVVIYIFYFAVLSRFFECWGAIVIMKIGFAFGNKIVDGKNSSCRSKRGPMIMIYKPDILLFINLSVNTKLNTKNRVTNHCLCLLYFDMWQDGPWDLGWNSFKFRHSCVTLD